MPTPLPMPLNHWSTASRAALSRIYTFFHPNDAATAISHLLLTGYFTGLVLMSIGVMFHFGLTLTGMTLALVSLLLLPFSHYRFPFSPLLVCLALWFGAAVLSDLANGLWWSEASEKIIRMRRLGALLVLLAAPWPLWRFRGWFLGLAVGVGALTVLFAKWQSVTGFTPFFPSHRMEEWHLAASGTYRAWGAFDHPLTFAGCCGMLTLYCTGLALHFDRRWRSLPWRVLCLLGAMVLFIGVLLTVSRGYLVVVIVVAAGLALTLRYRWMLLGGLVVVIGLNELSNRVDVQQRFADQMPTITLLEAEPGDTTAEINVSVKEFDRVARLYFGVQTWMDYPVFGVGHDYQRYWNAFITRAEPWANRRGHPYGGYHVHNTYLQIAIEMGTVGLVAFLALVYVAAREMIRRIFVEIGRGEGQIGHAVGGLAMLAVFLGGGLFEFNFDDTEIQLMLWFLMGLSLWPSWRPGDAAPQPRRSPWPVSGWILGYWSLGLALIFSAWSSWNTDAEVVRFFGMVDVSRLDAVLALLIAAAIAFGAMALEIREVRKKPGASASPAT